MGVPNPVDMMDHIDCSAIYIDPRIQSERWVFQGASDTPSGPLILADEPESLRSDIQVLLDVCRRSMLVNDFQTVFKHFIWPVANTFFFSPL
jgi:3',5'-cyclic-nucleotide phosphodiesterase